MNDSKIIVSLDFSNPERATAFLKKFDPTRCYFKIGKECFTKAGPAFVEKWANRDYKIFLDLKFHDIPTTVAKACSVAADLGVWMLNIHAIGGKEMMLAAREAIDKKLPKPLLVAVTVLTSMDSQSLKQIGITDSVNTQVIRLANLANLAKLDGVICSGHEVALLRQKLAKKFCLVTPGIRPATSKKQDQKRVMTPAEAIKAGSNYLVIGRPITQALDPLKMLESIEEEIATFSQCQLIPD